MSDTVKAFLVTSAAAALGVGLLAVFGEKVIGGAARALGAVDYTS